jgi:hypothetical protein
MTIARWPGVLSAALSALALAPSASASCAALPPLEKSLTAAEVVFVGTVTRLEHDARVATFRVEEVWKGAVGSTVVVNGSDVSVKGLEDAERRGLGIESSEGRTYELGIGYLVVPHGVSGELLLDNGCSATQLYASELEAFGPTREPPEGTSGLTFGLLTGAIGIAAAAASAGLWLRRTKRLRSLGASGSILRRR